MANPFEEDDDYLKEENDNLDNNLTGSNLEEEVKKSLNSKSFSPFYYKLYIFFM